MPLWFAFCKMGCIDQFFLFFILVKSCHKHRCQRTTPSLCRIHLWGIRIKSTQCQTTGSPREGCGSSGGAVPMGLTQTVPQLTGTLLSRCLWAPRTSQGHQCPKGFDNWFYGLEHCMSWLRTPWHTSPMLLVSKECYFGG